MAKRSVMIWYIDRLRQYAGLASDAGSGFETLKDCREELFVARSFSLGDLLWRCRVSFKKSAEHGYIPLAMLKALSEPNGKRN